MQQRHVFQQLVLGICRSFLVLSWTVCLLGLRPAVADFDSRRSDSSDEAIALPVVAIVSDEQTAVQSLRLPKQAFVMQAMRIDVSLIENLRGVVGLIDLALPRVGGRANQCDVVQLDLSSGILKVEKPDICSRSPSKLVEEERSDRGLIVGNVAYFFGATKQTLVVRPLEPVESQARASIHSGSKDAPGDHLVAFRDSEGELVAVVFSFSNSTSATVLSNPVGQSASDLAFAKKTRLGADGRQPEFHTCYLGKCIKRVGLGFSSCIDDRNCRGTRCSRDDKGFFCERSAFPLKECSSNAECGPQHKECVQDEVGFKCRYVSGSGIDDCTDDGSCNRVGKKCGTRIGFAVCESDPNNPRVSCQDRSDCATGKTCNKNGECVLGGGGDNCNDAKKDCLGGTSAKHMKCDCANGGICVSSPGSGANECLSHYDCIQSCRLGLEKRRACVAVRNGQNSSIYCSFVDGRGKDKCQDKGDCLGEGDSSTCVIQDGNYRCRVSRPGDGKQVCKSDVDCLPEAVGTLCGVDDYGAPICVQTLGIKGRACRSDSDCHSRVVKDGQRASGVLYGSTQDPHVESSLAFQEVSIGNASAPLQIEIFQDTDCGMCRFAFKEMVPQIVEGYVKAGKARITFKEYPLVVNTDAVNRVKALWCSANQNKYGPLLAELYGWDEKAGGHLILEQVAASTGIDMVEFRRCVASSRANDFVNQSIREGQSRGVDGTPSIYVNGNLVGGARSFDEMKSLLDDILANRSVSHD